MSFTRTKGGGSSLSAEPALCVNNTISCLWDKTRKSKFTFYVLNWWFDICILTKTNLYSCLFFSSRIQKVSLLLGVPVRVCVCVWNCQYRTLKPLIFSNSVTLFQVLMFKWVQRYNQNTGFMNINTDIFDQIVYILSLWHWDPLKLSRQRKQAVPPMGLWGIAVLGVSQGSNSNTYNR